MILPFDLSSQTDLKENISILRLLGGKKEKRELAFKRSVGIEEKVGSRNFRGN